MHITFRPEVSLGSMVSVASILVSATVFLMELKSDMREISARLTQHAVAINNISDAVGAHSNAPPDKAPRVFLPHVPTCLSCGPRLRGRGLHPDSHKLDDNPPLYTPPPEWKERDAGNTDGTRVRNATHTQTR